MQEVNGTEVVPTEAHGECEVGTELPVVLEEKSPPGCARVFADIGRNAGMRVKGSDFLVGCVVQEIPVVIKAPIWASRPGCVLHEMKLGDFSTELHGVSAFHLGHDILVTVRPLVEDAAGCAAKPIDVGQVADVAATVRSDVRGLRQTKRSLRV